MPLVEICVRTLRLLNWENDDDDDEDEEIRVYVRVVLSGIRGKTVAQKLNKKEGKGLCEFCTLSLLQDFWLLFFVFHFSYLHSFNRALLPFSLQLLLLFYSSLCFHSLSFSPPSPQLYGTRVLLW